jgi:hypothetical protein
VSELDADMSSVARASTRRRTARTEERTRWGGVYPPMMIEEKPEPVEPLSPGLGAQVLVRAHRSMKR